MARAILQSIRPRQWTKNIFVFAGLLFTLDQRHPPEDFVRVGLAFILFCIISGSVYLFNDIQDIERDRKHPLKSTRPIASGRLGVGTAVAAAVLLGVIGLAGAFALDRTMGGIALAYMALLTAYSLLLKHIVIVDVMAVAAGFVMRAAAGTVVIDVVISPWLLICTILLALFLGLAKRRGELVRLENDAAVHRLSLEHYSIPFLDQLLGITASSTIIAYALYTFSSYTAEQHPRLILTLPFVIYGVFRYLLLVHRYEGAESPERLLLSDKPLLADVALWVVACAVIIYTG